MNPQLDRDYYRRIDFPVSRVWADHYEGDGYIVHKKHIREEPPISADVTPETAQLLARIMERQDELTVTMNDRLGEQQKQLDGIKDYLRTQHQKQNAFTRPLTQRPQEEPTGKLGLKL